MKSIKYFLLCVLFFLAIPSFATFRTQPICTAFNAGEPLCTATQTAPWRFAYVNVQGNYEIKTSVTCQAVSNGLVKLHLIYTTVDGIQHDTITAQTACDGSFTLNGDMIVDLKSILYKTFLYGYLETSGTSAPFITTILVLQKF